MKWQPPSRLRDDATVGAALRRDLAQVPRSAQMPIDYDVPAGVARFEATLAAATTVGTSAPGAPGAGQAHAVSPVGSKAALFTGLKGVLFTGATVVVLAVGVATLGHRLLGKSNSSAPERSHVAAPAVSNTANAAALPLQTPIAEPAAPGSADELGSSSAALKPPSARVAATATVSSPNAKRASVPVTTESVNQAEPVATDEQSARVSAPSASLAQEMDHLARLRSLETSRPEAALRMAQEGDTLFPQGLFRQERQAIAIQSLVRLKRISEAKQRARAFMAAYPRSPFAERMKQLTDSGAE